MARTPDAALDWTNDDLAAMTAPTPANLAAGRSWWHRYAPRADRDLLDRGTTDIARCVRAHGRLEKTTDALVVRLHGQLVTGEIDTVAWQRGNGEIIAMNALCAIAAMRGGWDNVRITDFA